MRFLSLHVVSEAAWEADPLAQLGHRTALSCIVPAAMFVITFGSSEMTRPIRDSAADPVLLRALGARRISSVSIPLLIHTDCRRPRYTRKAALIAKGRPLGFVSLKPKTTANNLQPAGGAARPSGAGGGTIIHAVKAILAPLTPNLFSNLS